MSRTKWLLVTAVLFLLTACVTKEPDYGLLIEHWSDDLRQIYRIVPSDSQPYLLMEIPVRDPYWVSPKGSYVAVIHKNSATRTPLMTLYDLATGEALSTIEDVGQFNFEEIPYTENVVWAPDEQSIVFLRPSSEGNGTDLWIYDIESSSLHALSEDEAVERAPSWSPDGTLLVYASLPDCNGSAWDCPVEESFWQVKILSLADRESKVLVDKQQITEYQRDVLVQQRGLCNFVWSPNLQSLLFEDGCRPIGPSTYKEFYTVSINEGNLRRITNFSDGSLIRYAVSWTADGNYLHIAYAKAPFGPEDPEVTLATNVVVLETVGFTIQNEFTLSGNDVLPEMAWSNDGTLLAEFPFEGNTIIGELNGRELSIDSTLQLPTGNCFPPQWSPTGNYVAYVSTSGSETPCSSEGNYSLILANRERDVASDLMADLEGYIRIIGWYPHP